LYYTDTKPQKVELAGDRPYKVDLVDPWEMTVTPQGTAQPGEYTVRPTKSDLAYRFTPFAPGEESAQIKWHPGHYMLVWGGYSQKHFDTIVGSSFQGAQVRYDWRDLEPTKDQYDFSKIESDLAYLQQHGKRLVIQLMDRRFHSSKRPLPDYLYEDPTYHGGVEPFTGKGGCVARLWDAVVRERQIALIQALGKRFDREPYFEAFCFEETAIGIDKNRAAGFTHRGYLDSLKEVRSTTWASTSCG
jgi:hypothetical protein